MTKWLAAGIVAEVVLALLLAQAPPALRRLVVTPAIFGAFSGGILFWLAKEFGVRRASWRIGAAALLTCAGLIYSAHLSHQQFRTARLHWLQQHPDQLPTMNLVEQMLEQDPETRARYAAERERMQPRFRTFLVHRVSKLGDWPWPVALLFWVIEIGLAAVLAALVFRRLTLLEHVPRDASPEARD